MLKTPSLRNALVAISRQFEAVKRDALTDDFARIVRGSPEDQLRSSRRVVGRGAGRGKRCDGPPRRWASRRRCRRYATDLTDKARKGEIDPVSPAATKRSGRSSTS